MELFALVITLGVMIGILTFSIFAMRRSISEGQKPAPLDTFEEG